MLTGCSVRNIDFVCRKVIGEELMHGLGDYIVSVRSPMLIVGEVCLLSL